MKIIQSFWSANNPDIFDSKGWMSAKYHWLSWILSVNQLRKYHEEVELYTDEFGYKILIEKLQLPYTKVHVVLDELNHYPQGLWAISKIKTYSLQNEPFIHVDGDVFVWESLTDKFKNSGLLTQNLELTTHYYGKMWENLMEHIYYIPEIIRDYHEGNSTFACNMGIVGGNDLNFIKKYCKEAFHFVNKNKNSWIELSRLNFNVFYEQVIFHDLAKKLNIPIDFLFQEISEDHNYVGFGEFEKVPHKKTYLHLLGDYKRIISVCVKLDNYVLKHYPKQYQKCLDLLNDDVFTKENIVLNQKNNQKLVGLFLNDLKNATSILSKSEYFIARDVYSVDLLYYFETTILENKPIYLHQLDGLEKIASVVGEEEFLIF